MSKRSHFTGNAHDDKEGMLDVTGASHVQIQVDREGRTIWVNINGACRLRVNKIDGGIEIDDGRVVLALVRKGGRI